MRPWFFERFASPHTVRPLNVCQASWEKWSLITGFAFRRQAAKPDKRAAHVDPTSAPCGTHQHFPYVKMLGSETAQ